MLTFCRSFFPFHSERLCISICESKNLKEKSFQYSGSAESEASHEHRASASYLLHACLCLSFSFTHDIKGTKKGFSSFLSLSLPSLSIQLYSFCPFKKCHVFDGSCCCCCYCCSLRERERLSFSFFPLFAFSAFLFLYSSFQLNFKTAVRILQQPFFLEGEKNKRWRIQRIASSRRLPVTFFVNIY